jgi:hypothetical protein
LVIILYIIILAAAGVTDHEWKAREDGGFAAPGNGIGRKQKLPAMSPAADAFDEIRRV